MADFPKLVCDKCVDSCQHLDLLFHEVHEEKIVSESFMINSI